MNPERMRQRIRLFIALNCLAILTGCAGISRGIAEAVLDSKNRKEDTRICYIRGRPIEGIKTFLDAQEAVARQGTAKHHILKVLMVHGIGSHQPGYSTRMAENLARALHLDRVQENYKQFRLSFPAFSERDLGILRFSRYLNADTSREMIFAELTWDPIVEAEKQELAFDNSGEYSFRRTPLNNTLKKFINDTLPDVLMYKGTSGPLIQMSVAQTLCWLMTPSWETLPNGGVHYCNGSVPEHLAEIDDEYVFITHSLGSRVTVDALQWMTELATAAAKDDPVVEATIRRLRDKRFTVFMLSNQLPLLQLGQPLPEVHGRIAEICGPGAPRSDERFFGETHLVAVSDPNDLFSYAIPPGFLDKYVDSRLCPTLTNVILNIAEVGNVLGGEFANPLAAHTEYDNDARVLDIITGGIGTGHTAPLVTQRCTWLEVVPGTQPKGK
jgi:hypothetical protein